MRPSTFIVLAFFFLFISISPAYSNGKNSKLDLSGKYEMETELFIEEFINSLDKKTLELLPNKTILELMLKTLSVFVTLKKDSSGQIKYELGSMLSLKSILSEDFFILPEDFNYKISKNNIFYYKSLKEKKFTALGEIKVKNKKSKNFILIVPDEKGGEIQLPFNQISP